MALRSIWLGLNQGFKKQVEELQEKLATREGYYKQVCSSALVPARLTFIDAPQYIHTILFQLGVRIAEQTSERARDQNQSVARASFCSAGYYTCPLLLLGKWYTRPPDGFLDLKQTISCGFYFHFSSE